MPELRRDPIIGRWVIISSERGKRPSDFAAEHEPSGGPNCPFCEGNEALTPPEIHAVNADGAEGREPNTPGWQVRVVPNKFPALRIEGDFDRHGVGMYDMMNGVGAHEVIIENPRHDRRLHQLPPKKVELVVGAYRQRIVDLTRDPRFRYILVFKNEGKAAGASLFHSHSQLIATPIVPKRVSEELEGAKIYYGWKERCVFCDIIIQEMEQAERVVCENEQFISLEPFAPRFPFETWILPKAHRPLFERDNDLGLLAEILSETLRRLAVTLDSPPYNYLIHNTPTNGRGTYLVAYHGHIVVMPKLTKVAGFECGTGFYITPT
ncbi:MAG: galactose-1-phosphate uridylyltransferase, partial [bacterium]|nr:galactose-1-phosphate uridylyltransferase [bacterium]